MSRDAPLSLRDRRDSSAMSGNSNATNSDSVQIHSIDTHRVKTNRREHVFKKLFMITIYVYVETQYTVALKKCLQHLSPNLIWQPPSISL